MNREKNTHMDVNISLNDKLQPNMVVGGDLFPNKQLH